ncbi:MAG TPA: alpha/beta fold hydrolase [Candidatus Angelobacter sp.]|nr:alpha/beta fold hydrolase [Candidatus Angelobacter sp.]
MQQTMISKDKWIRRFRAQPNAGMRLFCFPYAGGSSVIYQGWQEAFPNLEISAIELPGHGVRFQETPLVRMEPIVDALVTALPLDRPYAFFGYSLGARVAFELTRRLRRDRRQEPLHLFAAASPAPHIIDEDPPKHLLPEPEFLAALRKLGGTPEEALNQPELMELVSKVLRADFAVLETYRCEPDAPLSCPLTVFGGHEDHEVPFEELEAWKIHTTGAFALRMFAGGHFFLRQERTALLSAVSGILSGGAASASV